ncbi:NAD-dependent epimerase/dehydratase family protein [Candidatus Amarolinea dominans]|uniref:NAD-dependent epimerase/dehydratase family protein n=1 Tax=Candidatus Amarolinea dominans TaxID=3140696 RepID=UPI001DC7499A|nr:NAD-dependent epimerase/dehydratase family protein [Anaerolineae bacterium]MBK7201785.1 NAD-dependent epimerase/dehydratase family protein [Anaerolineae bacterium]MBK9094711.1 NAD-dependent epimerase/dehydratase family protein [Anaerolineae bacterium]MBK9233986.1 NAD-dependent epimerase/dehydratase family protein [Anaerolineae bacterium]
MRILVTGGAGFIGSHVTDVMLAAGHEVIVVDNLSSGKRANLNPQVSAFYELDILDADGLQQVFAAHRPHAVSHQAALANVRESLHEPARYAEVNLLGSINLLEAARRHDCQRIIYASTGGACYGEPLFVPVTEDHPINPLDPYGASKHAVEHYLYLYQHNYGLAYTILRYPNVYGPRQDPLGEAGVIAIFTGAMLAGREVTINGSGEQVRDFVYVGDIARGNLLALQTPGSAIYNLGSAVGTSVNTIFAELQGATQYPLAPHYGPAKLGEVSRTYLDASQARRDLGWEPRMSLHDGLRLTADSFR